MHYTTSHFRHSFVCRAVSVILTFVFSFGVVFPPYIAEAQVLPMLPLPGVMVTPTPGYMPALIKGITVHPENPLAFDFIIDTGDSGIDLKSQEFKDESIRLIKYFLASLTVPSEEMWVNLSPYEKGRVIPEAFGKTEMGINLLAQDYILKQLTASLIYPEDELGKTFWNRVYERAQKEFGTRDIPLENFHKVWIVPDDAFVYEKDNTAFVVRSHLKVMMEEDYLAMRRARPQDAPLTGVPGTSRPTELQTEVMREVIIPEIEKEVNEGENFAQLRQIYQGMILAVWFKQNLKESLLGQVYVDRKKLKGVDTDDPAQKEKIYEQYLKAFEQGVYNYIREDYNPQTQEITPRQYFSGGFVGEVLDSALLTANDKTATPAQRRQGLAAAQREFGLIGLAEIELAESPDAVTFVESRAAQAAQEPEKEPADSAMLSQEMQAAIEHYDAYFTSPERKSKNIREDFDRMLQGPDIKHAVVNASENADKAAVLFLGLQKLSESWEDFITHDKDLFDIKMIKKAIINILVKGVAGLLTADYIKNLGFNWLLHLQIDRAEFTDNDFLSLLLEKNKEKSVDMLRSLVKIASDKNAEEVITVENLKKVLEINGPEESARALAFIARQLDRVTDKAQIPSILAMAKQTEKEQTADSAMLGQPVEVRSRSGDHLDKEFFQRVADELKKQGEDGLGVRAFWHVPEVWINVRFHDVFAWNGEWVVIGFAAKQFAEKLRALYKDITAVPELRLARDLFSNWRNPVGEKADDAEVDAYMAKAVLYYNKNFKHKGADVYIANMQRPGVRDYVSGKIGLAEAVKRFQRSMTVWAHKPCAEYLVAHRMAFLLGKPGSDDQWFNLVSNKYLFYEFKDVYKAGMSNAAEEVDDGPWINVRSVPKRAKEKDTTDSAMLAVGIRKNLYEALQMVELINTSVASWGGLNYSEDKKRLEEVRGDIDRFLNRSVERIQVAIQTLQEVKVDLDATGTVLDIDSEANTDVSRGLVQLSSDLKEARQKIGGLFAQDQNDLDENLRIEAKELLAVVLKLVSENEGRVRKIVAAAETLGFDIAAAKKAEKSQEQTDSAMLTGINAARVHLDGADIVRTAEKGGRIYYFAENRKVVVEEEKETFVVDAPDKMPSYSKLKDVQITETHAYLLFEKGKLFRLSLADREITQIKESSLRQVSSLLLADNNSGFYAKAGAVGGASRVYYFSDDVDAADTEEFRVVVYMPEGSGDLTAVLEAGNVVYFGTSAGGLFQDESEWVGHPVAKIEKSDGGPIEKIIRTDAGEIFTVRSGNRLYRLTDKRTKFSFVGKVDNSSPIEQVIVGQNAVYAILSDKKVFQKPSLSKADEEFEYAGQLGLTEDNFFIVNNPHFVGNENKDFVQMPEDEVRSLIKDLGRLLQEEEGKKSREGLVISAVKDAANGDVLWEIWDALGETKVRRVYYLDSRGLYTRLSGDLEGRVSRIVKDKTAVWILTDQSELLRWKISNMSSYQYYRPDWKASITEFFPVGDKGQVFVIINGSLYFLHNPRSSYIAVSGTFQDVSEKVLAATQAASDMNFYLATSSGLYQVEVQEKRGGKLTFLTEVEGPPVTHLAATDEGSLIMVQKKEKKGIVSRFISKEKRVATYPPVVEGEVTYFGFVAQRGKGNGVLLKTDRGDSVWFYPDGTWKDAGKDEGASSDQAMLTKTVMLSGLESFEEVEDTRIKNMLYEGDKGQAIFDFFAGLRDSDVFLSQDLQDLEFFGDGQVEVSIAIKKADEFAESLPPAWFGVMNNGEQVAVLSGRHYEISNFPYHETKEKYHGVFLDMEHQRAIVSFYEERSFRGDPLKIYFCTVLIQKEDGAYFMYRLTDDQVEQLRGGQVVSFEARVRHRQEQQEEPADSAMLVPAETGDVSDDDKKAMEVHLGAEIAGYVKGGSGRVYYFARNEMMGYRDGGGIVKVDVSAMRVTDSMTFLKPDVLETGTGTYFLNIEGLLFYWRKKDKAFNSIMPNKEMAAMVAAADDNIFVQSKNSSSDIFHIGPKERKGYEPLNGGIYYRRILNKVSDAYLEEGRLTSVLEDGNDVYFQICNGWIFKGNLEGESAPDRGRFVVVDGKTFERMREADFSFPESVQTLDTEQVQTVVIWEDSLYVIFKDGVVSKYDTLEVDAAFKFLGNLPEAGMAGAFSVFTVPIENTDGNEIFIQVASLAKKNQSTVYFLEDGLSVVGNFSGYTLAGAFKGEKEGQYYLKAKDNKGRYDLYLALKNDKGNAGKTFFYRVAGSFEGNPRVFTDGRWVFTMTDKEELFGRDPDKGEIIKYNGRIFDKQGIFFSDLTENIFHGGDRREAFVVAKGAGSVKNYGLYMAGTEDTDLLGIIPEEAGKVVAVAGGRGWERVYVATQFHRVLGERSMVFVVKLQGEKAPSFSKEFELDVPVTHMVLTGETLFLRQENGVVSRYSPQSMDEPAPFAPILQGDVTVFQASDNIEENVFEETDQGDTITFFSDGSYAGFDAAGKKDISYRASSPSPDSAMLGDMVGSVDFGLAYLVGAGIMVALAAPVIGWHYLSSRNTYLRAMIVEKKNHPEVWEQLEKALAELDRRPNRKAKSILFLNAVALHRGSNFKVVVLDEGESLAVVPAGVEDRTDSAMLTNPEKIAEATAGAKIVWKSKGAGNVFIGVNKVVVVVDGLNEKYALDASEVLPPLADIMEPIRTDSGMYLLFRTGELIRISFERKTIETVKFRKGQNMKVSSMVKGSGGRLYVLVQREGAEEEKKGIYRITEGSGEPLFLAPIPENSGELTAVTEENAGGNDAYADLYFGTSHGAVFHVCERATQKGAFDIFQSAAPNPSQNPDPIRKIFIGIGGTRDSKAVFIAKDADADKSQGLFWILDDESVFLGEMDEKTVADFGRIIVVGTTVFFITRDELVYMSRAVSEMRKWEYLGNMLGSSAEVASIIYTPDGTGAFVQKSTGAVSLMSENGLFEVGIVEGRLVDAKKTDGGGMLLQTSENDKYDVYYRRSHVLVCIASGLQAPVSYILESDDWRRIWIGTDLTEVHMWNADEGSSTVFRTKGISPKRAIGQIVPGDIDPAKGVSVVLNNGSIFWFKEPSSRPVMLGNIRGKVPTFQRIKRDPEFNRIYLATLALDGVFYEWNKSRVNQDAPYFRKLHSFPGRYVEDFVVPKGSDYVFIVLSNGELCRWEKSSKQLSFYTPKLDAGDKPKTFESYSSGNVVLNTVGGDRIIFDAITGDILDIGSVLETDTGKSDSAMLSEAEKIEIAKKIFEEQDFFKTWSSSDMGTSPNEIFRFLNRFWDENKGGPENYFGFLGENEEDILEEIEEALKGVQISAFRAYVSYKDFTIPHVDLKGALVTASEDKKVFQLASLVSMDRESEGRDNRRAPEARFSVRSLFISPKGDFMLAMARLCQEALEDKNNGDEEPIKEVKKIFEYFRRWDAALTPFRAYRLFESEKEKLDAAKKAWGQLQLQETEQDKIVTFDVLSRLWNEAVKNDVLIAEFIEDLFSMYEDFLRHAGVWATTVSFEQQDASTGAVKKAEHETVINPDYFRKNKKQGELMIAAVTSRGAGLEESAYIMTFSSKADFLMLMLEFLEENKKAARTATLQLDALVSGETEETDQAMLGEDKVGGIDLNPEFLDLKIKRDGNGIPLPMLQQPMELLKEIEGFLPVIINITPVQNLPMLLGLDTTAEDEDDPTQVGFNTGIDPFEYKGRFEKEEMLA